MGVKQLWSVLDGGQSTVTLDDLRGKKLAVDLSGWICQAERNKQLRDKQHIKPILRTLLYRVSLLLRHQVQPVFVLDGPACELKADTLLKRHEQTKKYYSFSGCSGSDLTETDQPGRYRLHDSYKVKQCCELLSALGVPYIRSSGEAEKTCALLNAHQVVDGCVSEDSDIFLYGAKTVYRNFSVADAKSDGIRCYKMADIEGKLHLSRDKLVALSLLLGCDYDCEGVRGIGPVKALKLLTPWPMDGVCDRLGCWRGNKDLDKVEKTRDMKRPTHCSRCQHLGTLSEHKRQGCERCHVDMACMVHTSPGWCHCTCTWHTARPDDQKLLEVDVRCKALCDPGFPDQQIITEYMRDLEAEDDWSQITWSRPDIHKLQAILPRWSYDKLCSTVLPMVTGWDIAKLTSKSTPDRIVKSCRSQGVDVYDVRWSSIEGIPPPTVDDTASQQDAEGSPSTEGQSSGSPGSPDDLITEEIQTYFMAAFPDVVKTYNDEIDRVKLLKKSAKRKVLPVDSSPTKQQKLDSFFKVKKPRRASSDQDIMK